MLIVVEYDRIDVLDGQLLMLRRLHDIHRWHWVRRSPEWKYAPVRVADWAELVAVRDSSGDAVEVEHVGALGHEDGLPASCAHAAETDSTKIHLPREHMSTQFYLIIKVLVGNQTNLDEGRQDQSMWNEHTV
jgi:hypothetical protein